MPQIFSDMVLFPMPSCTRIKPRLARELSHLFETFDDKVKDTRDDAGVGYSTPIADLFLWALVLGGIAASFTDHRPWFERQLRMRLGGRERDNLGVDSNAESASASPSPSPSESEPWPSFKDRVSRFLWWDPVVDTPARDLWEAATRETAVEAQARNQEP
jgi:hypothetical protein